MRAIFKNPVLQQQFETEGYVILDLLDTEAIGQLTGLFHHFHPGTGQNQFESSSYLSDITFKLQLRDTLRPIFQPFLDRHFQDYTYFGSAYLFKTPGNRSDVPAHQDWTIVNEKENVAINIWTPLIDTDEQNGTLYVIPGSQSSHIFSIRAPTIPFYFQEYMDEVMRCLVPLPAKAGQAVVLNQSLIHYSPPNLSDKIRIAITTGIKSAGAEMIFHYRDPDIPGKLQVYQVPEDFLLQFRNFHEDIYKRPENSTLLREIDFSPPTISKSEFHRRFGRQSESFWNRMIRKLVPSGHLRN